MKVTLLGLHAGASPSKFVVGRFPAVIGRSPDADLCLEDRWASRVHCVLYDLEGTLMVRDLGSRNGTLVNGTRITETHLLPGDQLTVGLTAFAVKYRPARRRARAARTERQGCNRPMRVVVDFRRDDGGRCRPAAASPET